MDLGTIILSSEALLINLKLYIIKSLEGNYPRSIPIYSIRGTKQDTNNNPIAHKPPAI